MLVVDSYQFQVISTTETYFESWNPRRRILWIVFNSKLAIIYKSRCSIACIQIGIDFYRFWKISRHILCLFLDIVIRMTFNSFDRECVFRWLDESIDMSHLAPQSKVICAYIYSARNVMNWTRETKRKTAFVSVTFNVEYLHLQVLIKAFELEKMYDIYFYFDFCWKECRSVSKTRVDLHQYHLIRISCDETFK